MQKEYSHFSFQKAKSPDNQSAAHSLIVVSHKYEVELVETKNNILFLKKKLDGLEEKRKSKDNFLKAVGSTLESRQGVAVNYLPTTA